MENKLETRIEWSDSNKNHLIFYGDIMGFKNLVATNSHQQMNEKLIKFFDEVDTKSQPLVGRKMRMMRFSDSILLVTESDKNEDLNRLTKAIIRLMQHGLRTKMPIRGAIARGKLSIDENRQLIFGQALLDAYLLEEELYYYGVAVHHSAEEMVVRNLTSQPYHMVDLPMKSGMIPHYQLSYHHMGFSLSPKDVTEEVKRHLAKIQSEVSCRPRLYVKNTIDVLDRVNKTYPFEDGSDSHNT